MMQKDKIKKEKRSVFGLFKKLAFVCVVVMLFVSFVSGRLSIVDKQNELNAATLLLQEQQTKNEELERLVEKGDEDEYIVRYAREKLGYIWPGEKILLDITGK